MGQLDESLKDRNRGGAVLHDQLRIIFSHIIPNTVASLIVALVYYWTLRDQFIGNIQYYWLSALSILLIVRLFLHNRSVKYGMRSGPMNWLIYYGIIMFALGCAWGSVVLIPVEIVEDSAVPLVVIALLLGFAAISAVSSAAHPIAIWPFLAPIACFSALYLINTPNEDYGLILGIGAFVFCGAIGLSAHGIHKMITSALLMQSRNSSLMDEVVEIAKQNQKSYEGFQVLLDNLGAGAAMFDKRHKIVSWNKSFENIFNVPVGLIKRGMSLNEIIRKVIKQSWQNNIDVNHAADVHIKELLSDHDDNEMVKLVLADGRNLYSKVMKITDDQIVLNYTDVTSLEQARADDIIHVLQHDNLTGLPNQVLHKKEVRRRISELEKQLQSSNDNSSEAFIGLIHFGLNSLNEIYEFLGLNAGDQVVTEIAERCKAFLGNDVHLSHIAYDEFHIITQNEKNVAEVIALAEKLVDVIGEPVEIAGNSITMTTSIGISVFPDHAEEADVLNRNAKIAFNKAKLPNQENIIVFEAGMHSEIMQRSNMLFDIRDSINKSQFSLHYQPQIDIKSNQIMGVEALLRWQHPEKGWISPGDFIPLAEHTKQIIPLTEQFLPEACRQAKAWQEQGLPSMKMSVNISPFHFHERGFIKFVQDCLEAVKLDPAVLNLEITEGVIMSQTDDIIKILQDLSEMGVQLSIDDFGTGFSSLSYLRTLPVDKLKIDQAFIKDMNRDDSALSLVEAVIRLGHSFNLNIIAEGVETEEQLNKLHAMNCDQAQGYFIKRPEKEDEITRWIKAEYT